MQCSCVKPSFVVSISRVIFVQKPRNCDPLVDTYMIENNNNAVVGFSESVVLLFFLDLIPVGTGNIFDLGFPIRLC